MKASATVSPLMLRLAAYVANARRRALPSAVTIRAKCHLLDTIAAMISGASLQPGLRAIAYVSTLGGSAQATVVGSRIVTGAANAALANGMLAHADETDDSHARSLIHPGCGIVAAALAQGESNAQNGTSLLRAVALGYDIATRMSLALGTTAFRNVGHSTHSMAPTFGATAAAALLAQFDERQVRHAFSYAAQQASGLSCYTRDLDHVEKAFDFGGMPARNGVTAVGMVAAGCTAVDDVFSGERNFFAAYDESARIGIRPQPALLLRRLGQTFEITQTNIKRWTVGSPIQAPLDSLLALIRQHRIKASEVDHMTVRISQLGANTTDNRDMPNICLQHLCAVMLIDGIVTFESAHNEHRMRDPAVLAVRKRIALIGDAKLEKLLPARHGIVELNLRDGRRLNHHTRAVRGTAQNPMTPDEVDEKCFALIAPCLGRGRARKLCNTVWQIEKVDNLRRLRHLLQV
jgi:2-methylcitrate dehydratase PrpD